MSKIVEIKKKTPEHEQVADMLESFAAALRDNAHGISDKLTSAVLVYKIDGHGIVFETTSSATPEQVGMMCSAVHIACIYETQPETESIH